MTGSQEPPDLMHMRHRSRPAVFLRAVLVLALAALPLGACGGGGGGGVVEPAPEPEVEKSGLRGTVMVPGVELGRIVEQEPNNSAAQPYLLTPLFPRVALEVAGHVGTAADLGEDDATDVLRLVSIMDQDISLELTYRQISAVNDSISMTVIETESGTQLDTDAGPGQPLTATFSATAGTVYDIVVDITFGSAAYVIRAVLTDPPVAPKPGTALNAAPPSVKVAARPVQTAVAAGDPACACSHLLVRLTSDASLDAICAEYGLERMKQLVSGTWCLAFAHDSASAGRHKAVELAATLSARDDVVFAEPDWIVQPQTIPNDPKFGCQWNLRAIGCEHAWDITTGDADIVIGIVDTGILPEHPDLTGQIVPGYDFVSDPGIAGDDTGIDTDPTDVGDQILPSGLSTWHGTHVAGICVGVQNDGYGITGVAPGCKVMPLRALGIGGGLLSDLVTAIDFGSGLVAMPGRGILDEPLQIMNLSVGLGVDSPELEAACNRARNRGVLLIAAAGNTSLSVLYPAAYDSVMAVGAVDSDLTSTGYSSFGNQLELVAPGGLIQNDGFARGWPDHIFSCVRDETVFPSTMHHAGLQGTSQAAPHVAAAAALLLSIDPTLTVNELKAFLKDSALDVGAEGVDSAHGSGLLQVHRAMKMILEDAGTPRTDDPILQIPSKSVRFVGFDTLRVLPISNAGGGVLTLTAAQTATDDGVPWLSATLDPATGVLDSNVDELHINVERTGLAPGRYSGTIRLANTVEVLCALRVVMYVGQFPRAGRPVHIVAIDEVSGIGRKTTAVYPEYFWRYWITGVPESSYMLQAGEDLDEDTFFCEPADHCGWWGGALEADAISVPVLLDQPATQGLHILLFPPP